MIILRCTNGIPMGVVQGTMWCTMQNKFMTCLYRHGHFYGGEETVHHSHTLSCAHAQIVHWQWNIFKLKAFVEETSIFCVHVDSSCLESVALQTAMVLPALLLQNPHQIFKAKKHINIECRLQLRNIYHVIYEGRTIQCQLALKFLQNPCRSSRTLFCKIDDGRELKAALQMIVVGGMVLPLNDSVQRQQEYGTSLPATNCNKFSWWSHWGTSPSCFWEHHWWYHSSHLSSHWWFSWPFRSWYTSFGDISAADPCDAVAAVTRQLCTPYVDPQPLSSLISACRIGFGKCPG